MVSLLFSEEVLQGHVTKNVKVNECLNYCYVTIYVSYIKVQVAVKLFSGNI